MRGSRRQVTIPPQESCSPFWQFDEPGPATGPDIPLRIDLDRPPAVIGNAPLGPGDHTSAIHPAKLQAASVPDRAGFGDGDAPHRLPFLTGSTIKIEDRFP